MHGRILEFLTGKGYIGIAVAGFSEALFMPFPMEIVYIPVALADPRYALNYAFLLIASSFAGSITAYYIGKFSGKKLALRLGFIKKHFDKIQKIYDNNSFLAIMTSAFTPIPYEAYTLTAGIFSVRFGSFVIASMLSRIIRYVPQGILIYLYGHKVIAVLKSFGIFSAAVLFIITACIIQTARRK